MIPKCPQTKFRTQVKKNIKRSIVKQSKVDLLLWLEYLLMMQRLANAAQDAAKEDKVSTVSAVHIQKVTKVLHTRQQDYIQNLPAFMQRKLLNFGLYYNACDSSYTVKCQLYRVTIKHGR
ncbi:hypothetical protein KP79_PYT08716 [Mizuhopecten yessoensis]|uniref:Centromere protein W n=1 Tax=Mizuhopecten yessoensis TaxID=6573 RepID=A0A210QJH5_MIZYE|nr:hypothetical protein KP79_PYT08716 [Mizuhopecten yessoensis]